MSDNTVQAFKRRRISKACDYCHQRGIRCRPCSNNRSCQNCEAFNQPCTFHRPSKRRGAPPRQETRDESAAPCLSSHSDLPTSWIPREERKSAHFARPCNDTAQPDPPPPNPEVATQQSAWRAPTIADHAVVVDFVDLYFEIVYPIFPLFHQPSFVRRIARAEYTSSRTLFALTMAVCALVSARIRDGAVFNPQWALHSLREIKSQVYYNEAIRQVHAVRPHSDLNVLRTYAILALAAIQDGKIRDMHEHLGYYHTIVAMEGLHDESNWPKDIGLIESQERRRLFWSIYTLDVFTSIVWGGLMFGRENQSNISYPTEVDDEMFDDTGFANMSLLTGIGDCSPNQLQPPAPGTNWLAGRNIVTDLYRILEHIFMRFPTRKSRAQRPTLIDEVFQNEPSLPRDTVCNRVMQMYTDLPQCLKQVHPITCRPQLDRFGFQAADIIATVQLLRMVLLSNTSASISERCQIANEVVAAFTAIPTAYHHAISVPLIFHLGVIGQILGTTLEQPLSEKDYIKIREVLIAMAELLLTLEDFHASRGASQRLRDQIARIDKYMVSQRRTTTLHKQQHVPMRLSGIAEREALQEGVVLTYSRTPIDETLASPPLQLPLDLLDDFSQIFDFAQSSESWAP